MAIQGIERLLQNQGSDTQSVNNSSMAGSIKSLGRDTFLKLLVKQLQYQDPLNPMSNTDFTAQLAQFSSLEQMTNMSEDMKKLSDLQASMNNMQALDFLGKKVSAKGDIVEYNGQEVGLDFYLDKAASDVEVDIYDATGNLVRTINMQDVPSGDAFCQWDGKDNGGDTVGPGRYTFKVIAADAQGAKVNATTYATGTVSGVRYDDGVTYLVVGNKEVTISNIEKIQG